jgi:hypothetical protein
LSSIITTDKKTSARVAITGALVRYFIKYCIAGSPKEFINENLKMMCYRGDTESSLAGVVSFLLVNSLSAIKGHNSP